MRMLAVAVGMAISVGTMGGSAQLVSGAARAAAPAAAGSMSDSAACQVVKRVMPKQDNHTFALRKEGLVLDPGKKEKVIEYGSIEKVDFSPGVFIAADLFIHTKNPKATYHLTRRVFGSSDNESDQELQRALLTLANSARAGRTVVCSDDMREYAEELADFQVKTAAWRALAEKPKVGDEVYKDRLLAEDAVKNRDLNAAAKYYEAGVQAEPTWEQGWYNAALVYADLNDYFDAALCMKHYVILMPNAADAQAAKDNIILWEAKAPLPAQSNATNGKTAAGPVFGSAKPK